MRMYVQEKMNRKVSSLQQFYYVSYSKNMYL